MASYHLSVKTIKRSAGRTATAAGAYRAGERIECQREGRIHDYTRKQGIEAESGSAWTRESHASRAARASGSGRLLRRRGQSCCASPVGPVQLHRRQVARRERSRATLAAGPPPSRGMWQPLVQSVARRLHRAARRLQRATGGRPRLLLPTRSLLPSSTRLRRLREPIRPHQPPPLPLPLGTCLPPPLLVQAAASAPLPLQLPHVGPAPAFPAPLADTHKQL